MKQFDLSQVFFDTTIHVVHLKKIENVQSHTMLFCIYLKTAWFN